MLAFAPAKPDLLAVEVLELSGFEREPHGHRFYEVMYVTAGNGWHRVGLENSKVTAGSVLLVAPGEVHDTRGLVGVKGWLLLFEASVLDNGRQRWVDLPGEIAFLPFARSSSATPKLMVPAPDRAEWNARFASLATELEGAALGRELVVRAELESLLIRIARLMGPSMKLGAVNRPLLSEVFQFIDTRFAKPISLVDVAKAVRRSKAHLTTVVRQATGRSVLQWITERRMAEARRMLVETELEVGEIAGLVGFGEASYFIRRFQIAHHMTPLAFRQSVQQPK